MIRSSGLYDSDLNLLKTWDELLAAGLDLSVGYTNTDGARGAATSGYTVLYVNNPEGTILAIDNSITEIAKYSLAACTHLEQVIFPNTLVTIGERAFNNASSLTNLVIPESVTSIGQYAFKGNTSLVSVVINGRYRPAYFSGHNIVYHTVVEPLERSSRRSLVFIAKRVIFIYIGFEDTLKSCTLALCFNIHAGCKYLYRKLAQLLHHTDFFDNYGYVFLEIDGSVIEYTLAPGQSLIVDTGNLAAMDITVDVNIQTVKGVGNALFGGEGRTSRYDDGSGKGARAVRDHGELH